MPKPNHSFSVKEMKDYIRTHKLNKPEIKLSMRRHELIAGLKKIGHWSEPKKKARKKDPPVKTAEIRRIEPLPEADRRTVIDLSSRNERNNLMLDAFLKRYKHVSGRSAKSFMRYLTAYKNPKNTVDGVYGKDTTLTIRESKDGMAQVHVISKEKYVGGGRWVGNVKKIDTMYPFRLRK